MAYLGSWKIDDYITFYVNTHAAATGAATDADAVPPYRIYEDETGAAIANGNMALLDAGNTDGFYSERIQLQAVTGFEKGKQYVIYIAPTVSSVMGTTHHTFQIEAEVDANTVSDGVDVTSISGDSAAANNLETACDGGSYNIGGGGAVAASVTGAVGSVTGAVGSVTGAVGSVAGNVDGSVASVVAEVDADVTAISGDATAANNAESFFDGTGYAGTNNVMPITTTVTNRVTANVDQLDGDAQSLTDLKDFADAGYDPGTNKVQGVVLVDTTTTNTDMVGTNGALLAASVNVAAGVVESNLIQMGGVAQSGTDLKDFADAGYDPSTNKVEGVKLVDVTTTNTDMVAAAPTAAAVVNEWETQSQADPTGFHVNVLEIEGSDATNQIRDAVVDDATRIDASELNTLSGFAPASTIAAASDVPTAAQNVNEWETQSQADPTGFHVNLQEVADTAQTAGDLAALIGALNNISAADVNAQVLDVLNVDTFAEPGQGAPAATTTIQAKIAYLYKLMRNKLTQTATTLSVYNDAGAVVDQKATVSDDATTFTRGEIGSGP